MFQRWAQHITPSVRPSGMWPHQLPIQRWTNSHPLELGQACVTFTDGLHGSCTVQLSRLGHNRDAASISFPATLALGALSPMKSPNTLRWPCCEEAKPRGEAFQMIPAPSIKSPSPWVLPAQAPGLGTRDKPLHCALSEFLTHKTHVDIKCLFQVPRFLSNAIRDLGNAREPGGVRAMWEPEPRPADPTVSTASLSRLFCCHIASSKVCPLHMHQLALPVNKVD